MNIRILTVIVWLFFSTINGWGQKPELVVQTGHSAYVSSATFSPDDQYVLTIGNEYIAKLWDLSGRELRSFSSDSSTVESAVFSPNGEYILTGSLDKTAKLWDLKGNVIRTFSGHTEVVTSVVFSPNGEYVLTGSADRTVKLWDLSGNELQTFNYNPSFVSFTPNGENILICNGKTAKLLDFAGNELKAFTTPFLYTSAYAFSPDGQYLLTGNPDHTVKLWDWSGNQLQSFAFHWKEVSSIAVSPDGQFILTGSLDKTAVLWNFEGEVLQRFKGHSDVIESVTFSRNGKFILTASMDGTAKLWNLKGEELQAFQGHTAGISMLGFFPASSKDSTCLFAGGQYILTSNWDKTVKLWDVVNNELRLFENFNGPIVLSPACPVEEAQSIFAGTSSDGTMKLCNLSGKELRKFKRNSNSGTSLAFSPDGSSLLTRSWDKTAKLWSLDGKIVQSFKGHSDDIFSAAFSPDGQYILTGSADKTARLWTFSGREVGRFGHWSYVTSVAFSPDSQRILTGGSNGSVNFFDLEGNVLQSFMGHTERVAAITFSPDGQYILTGSWDKTAKLWDLTGKALISFTGHSGGVTTVSFSPDGSHVLTGSRDGVLKFWDTQSGELLADIYGFATGFGWVVVDTYGRFDGNEEGLKNLHYVVDLEAIPLNRLKDRYYEPGLLGKLLGFNQEPLRDVSVFDSVALFPSIQLTRQQDQLSVALTKRSGGIGRTALYINGSEKVKDLDPKRSNKFTIDLGDYQRYYYTDQPNVIGIQSYNEDGWLPSEPDTMHYKQQTQSLQLNTKPSIFALCIGTADYAGGTTLDLAYAEQDAIHISNAFEQGGNALLGDPERIEVVSLQTCLDQECPDEQRPTKKNIKAAFVSFAEKARPEDVFILYLSGHGKIFQDYFYYLTQDMGSDYLGDEALRSQYAISTAEFAEWLNAIPARKQVMIIDACSSGQFNENMAMLAMKNISGSQIRALDRLRDRTGLFIISGSANNQASYEASPYGMGLLTYSLLTGMGGGALREDEYMDVEKLFSFAEEQVPFLAEDIGAIQTPKFWKPEGSKSFDIGRATAQVKAQILLPSVKPVFSRVSFFNDETDGDELQLEQTLNGLLRDFAFAKGDDKALIFVDADHHPNAYRLRGRYKLEKDQALIAYSIFKANQRIGERIEFMADAKNLKALAKKIISVAYERVK
ncbi:MAG: hypothetical protein DHS20C18_15160 [Saprospiraceae bacterium]|nr:MAG: hypothetical protein DHS20C18_15160 [Saprospiraceae bacterium]